MLQEQFFSDRGLIISLIYGFKANVSCKYHALASIGISVGLHFLREGGGGSKSIILVPWSNIEECCPHSPYPPSPVNVASLNLKFSFLEPLLALEWRPSRHVGLALSFSFLYPLFPLSFFFPFFLFFVLFFFPSFPFSSFLVPLWARTPKAPPRYAPGG